MSSAPQHDWDQIELEYRAGVFSVEAISRRHKVSVSRIRVMARKRGWKRAQPSDKDVHDAANFVTQARVPSQSLFSSEDVRRAAVMTQATVISIHRKDIARLRTVSEDILKMVEVVVAPHRYLNQPELIEMAVRMFGPKESLADVVEKLSRIFQRTLDMERSAFGLKTFDTPNGDNNMTDEELDMEIERLRATGLVDVD